MQVDVDDFVSEFGGCMVQERAGVGPRDFRLSLLRRFYDQACDAAAEWSVHRDQARYIFHNNLIATADPGSTDALAEVFERHPPTEALIDLSERWPCIAMRLALGGPDSGTPSPHVHGTVQCLLLAGRKRWWLWPPHAAMLIEWIVRGAKARNRLEYWQHYIAPIFRAGRGDMTDHVFRSLDALTCRGLFTPVEPGNTRSHAFGRACEWVRRAREEGRGVRAEDFEPRVMVQEAGQAMSVPEHWSHAVRNEGVWNLAVIYELCLREDTPRRTSREVA